MTDKIRKQDCPKCGRPMKRYKTDQKPGGIDRQVWGCKMHEGKWGVWITIEGLETAGKAIL